MMSNGADTVGSANSLSKLARHANIFLYGGTGSAPSPDSASLRALVDGTRVV